ncbi:family 43 glycosylhydrolase [Plantactinospora siamensis]|uniref:Family 43 glycosylhydrolase n=1 Tax=Plantactinospora siamensis TaxID=555372 RepID=A0ABV6P2A8_9ACTN
MGTRRSAATLAGLTALILAGGTPASAAPEPARYRNPVTASFSDTFADPVVIRGQDGWWYAYATSDPLREGEKTPHRVPTARSADLTNWTYVGDAFSADQLPPYAAPGAALWAPDVRYIDGRYVMYFTVTDTTVSDDTFDTAIGAATAPTPTGPWTFAPEPVVAPRPGSGGGYLWTIDPAHLTDVDGTQYLYYGSYYGGISVTTLSADGLHATGGANMVAIDNKFEGSYVVRHDGWYYLFASTANCCAGPTTGYSVSVGRSRSPRGPFVDKLGQRLDVSRAGGTLVVAPNGNKWVGTGHNGFVSDLSGQDWLAYHAIDRADPYLDEPFGINERPMLLDRLDWVDGWPTVRAGAWASEDPQPAPVTATPVQDRFDTADLSGWRRQNGTWRVQDGHLTGTGTVRATRRLPDGDVHVQTDVRLTGAAGLALGERRDRVEVRIDAAAGRLVADAGAGVRASAPLPAGFDARHWHNLAVEVRGRQLTAVLRPTTLSGEQLATVRLRLPDPVDPSLSLLSRGRADFDNVSGARAYRSVSRTVPAPRVGSALPAYSDDFTGSTLSPAWTWVRPDPAVTVGGGALNWPVQSADLTGASNTASVLLRDAPQGDYVVETKVTLDLGEDTVRNYQQAGLIAYVNDDDFARLSQVAIWNTRQIEYGREIPYAGQTSYGGTIVGTPARTTWLRLARTVDPATGEQRFRAGSSQDGRTWIWGGVWTFPAGSSPRIGLVAHGGAEPPVTAAFDYFRVYAGH